jgi:hypothetical protein
MGDNNFLASGGTVTGLDDQDHGLSTLVAFAWVVGVARGMIPWFGAVKLYLQGNATMVPPQSWQFMGLTLIGLGLLAFGVHYAFRPREKEEEGDEDSSGDGNGGEGPPPHPRWRGLREWMGRSSAPPDESEADEEDRPDPRHSTASTSARRSSWRRLSGRPRPSVRRPKEKSRRPGRRRTDEDD